MTSPSDKSNEEKLTVDEMFLIYKILEHQYIDQENLAGHAAVNKMIRILRVNGKLT